MGDPEKAQLGLGHSYTHSELKFNVQRQPGGQHDHPSHCSAPPTRQGRQVVFEADSATAFLSSSAWNATTISILQRRNTSATRRFWTRKNFPTSLPSSTMLQGLPKISPTPPVGRWAQLYLKSTPLLREWYPYQTTSSCWFRIYPRSPNPETRGFMGFFIPSCRFLSSISANEPRGKDTCRP